jgi:hypothetical protein
MRRAGSLGRVIVRSMSTTALTISDNNGLTFSMQQSAGGLVLGLAMTDGRNTLAVAGSPKAQAALLTTESGIKCLAFELQTGLKCFAVNVNNGEPIYFYKRNGQPWKRYTGANQSRALSA